MGLMGDKTLIYIDVYKMKLELNVYADVSLSQNSEELSKSKML